MKKHSASVNHHGSANYKHNEIPLHTPEWLKSQRQTIASVDQDVKKNWNPHTLLVGM